MCEFFKTITFGNILTIIGWGVAFYYAVYNVKEAHKRNTELNKENFKQELEVKAFVEFREQLYVFHKTLIDLSIFQSHDIEKFINQKKIDPKDFLPSDSKICDELGSLINAAYAKFADFIMVYEGNELIFLDFLEKKNILVESMKAFFDGENKLYEVISKLTVIQASKEKSLDLSEVDMLNKELIKTIDIQGIYLDNLILAMQNKFLGPVFGRKLLNDNLVKEMEDLKTAKNN